MKFSAGVWTMRPGVRPVYAVRVHEHRVEGDELVLTCVDRSEPKSNINNYAIVLRLSAPFGDAIRVRVQHQLGRRAAKPVFALEPSALASAATTKPVVEENADTITFRSGELEAVITKRPYSLRFLRDGKLVCESRPNALGVMNVANDRDYLMQRLSLDVGECVYGFGERFAALVKNGQSLSIWNEDPGTETDLSYKTVPLYLTSKGHGVFVNHPGKVDFEVATERVAAVQFSVPDNELDYFVLSGPTQKGVLEKYTRLTGRPALPPIWSFGLWLSTSFLTDYDEKIVSSMIDGMFERKIPLSVFHFDCLWMREHHWCDFEWDPEKFKDPRGMLARLKARGLKICVWINPYISELSSLFAEGRDRGYFLKRANGDVYQRDDWQPGIALVDFTNPDAKAWYLDKLRALLDQGVDCFKTDFGERIPDDAVYFDGSDAARMHNFYAYSYNEAVFGLLEEARGKNEAVVFARSSTAGSQKFPVHWGGDCDATWTSMAETLRGGLSFGQSGGAFWSHDISGFNATATPALYKRWVAFGLLSSHSRLHGSHSYRVPWLFDEQSVAVLRAFTELKHRLMPYLWRAAHEATETGTPLLRAMALEFPDDPAARHLDQQYMLGSSLLVAPVFNDAGDSEYYLPEGAWLDWFTGERVQGGRFRAERGIGFERIPLFIRENTLLALGTRSDSPSYDFTRELTLELCEIADGATATCVVHPPSSGEAVHFTCTRRGARATLRAEGLRGAGPSVGVRGGVLTPWPDATRELTLELVR